MPIKFLLVLGFNFQRTQISTKGIMWHSNNGIEFEAHSQTATNNHERTPASYLPNAHAENKQR